MHWLDYKVYSLMCRYYTDVWLVVGMQAWFVKGNPFTLWMHMSLVVH